MGGRRSVFILLAVLAISGASPVVAAAQTGVGTATGTGTLYNGTQTFSFSATGDPNAATGTMHFEFHNESRNEITDAQVKCINVEGNGAFINGTVTASTGDTGLEPGDTITFNAIDVATPGAGSDLFVINLYPDTVPDVFAHCEVTPSAGGVLETGDIIVVPGATTAAIVTLSPPDAVNTAGTQHTVTATVSDATGGPVPSVSVLFSVQGSVSATGSCTTGANGQCSFTYTGPQLPGADVITDCADSNGNGTADTGEPCGTATKAWLLPTSSPGQVTGGGQVANAADNDQVAFGFNAKSGSKGVSGECTVVDPSTNTKVKCLDATTLIQAGTHATFFGNATVNDVATTYRIDVDDLAEPGAGRDTFKIQTANGYTVGGVLRRGNIQVHN